MPCQDLCHIDIRMFSGAAKGDISVFEVFFEAYKKRIFGVALKMLKSPAELRILRSISFPLAVETGLAKLTILKPTCLPLPIMLFIPI